MWTGEDLGAAKEGRGPSRGGRQHCGDVCNAGRGRLAMASRGGWRRKGARMD
jgi:hypothetical protein